MVIAFDSNNTVSQSYRAFTCSSKGFDIDDLGTSHQNKCVIVERRWILKSDILTLKFQLFHLLVVALGEIMFLSLRLQICKVGIIIMLNFGEFLLENVITLGRSCHCLYTSSKTLVASDSPGGLVKTEC